MRAMLTLIFGFLVSQSLFARSMDVATAMGSKGTRELNATEVNMLITCNPALISKYSGTVDYARLKFDRTDTAANSRSGMLTVSTIEQNPKNLMILTMDSNDEIFFSKDMGMLIVGHQSALGFGYDFYELNDGGSLLVGTTSSDDFATEQVRKLVDQDRSPLAKCSQ